ncbi:MAG: T9SS type A sorting domain-containing protein [Crocinitomicaceae bacterium]
MKQMKNGFCLLFLLLSAHSYGQYAPSADQAGTTAIHKDSAVFINWASTVVSFNRGLQDIANVSGPDADYGDSTAALGMAEGNSNNVVSLGDSGSIVLSFPYPIKNGSGPDFAVFENSFSHDYLELAHVEVSTDGINFVRFPSVSLTQTSTQVGAFDLTDPTKIYNLAGKYIQAYGTPFDLEELADSSGINVDSIHYVKIVDVVGSIDPTYGTTDSQGNLVNDPYPTAFGSGGFDLDAVGVIHENNIFASQEEYTDGFFRVYPNPASGQLNIQLSGRQEVAIYSISGTLIWKQMVEQFHTIDLAALGLRKGVYVISNQSQTLKLVVQ